MRADEIKDRDDLEQWLMAMPEDQGLQAARLIAHRAALRLLPSWAQYCATTTKTDLKAVPVFWCHLLSAVRVGDATVQIETFAAASAATATAGSATAVVAFAAAYAAGSAAAAQASSFAGAAGAAAAAAHAVAFADHSTARASSFADAVALERGFDLRSLPLWPDGADPFAETWTDAAPLFARHPAWAVLTDLYENALHGRPQNLPLLIDLAQKDKDLWTGPDAEVLDRIADVVGARALALTDNVEDIVVNPDTGKLRLVSMDQVPPDILRYARRKMARAIRIFDGQPANQYQPLDVLLRMLRDALDDCENMPVELFDTCASVSRMIAKMAQTETIPLPDEDALIGEFIAILRETAADILTADPATQDRLAKRNTLRKDNALRDVAQDIHKVVGDITQVSEGALTRLLPENEQTALNPAADPQDRQIAAYKLAGRLLRVNRTLRDIGGTLSDYKELVHFGKVLINSTQFQTVIAAIMRALGLG